MQSFDFSYPTTVHFGEGALERSLPAELAKVGKTVMLAYGGGSIKRNGVYDAVMGLLAKAGKDVVEFAGIMPNPTYAKVQEGARLAREKGVDFILAVGGGSVIDCSKAIAAGAVSELDAWELVVDSSKIKKALPLFTVLTLSATGSEYDNSAVISNLETNEKLGFASDFLAPVASICDPTLTFSVPANQTAAGVADIMSHTFEQYMVIDGNPVSDGICETILRTCIEYAPKAIANPEDEDARAALMLASSFGCNGLLALDRTPSPWPCHGIEHEISAWHDITHGVGLAIITPHWMRYSLNEKTAPRFAQYAVNVWGMDPKGDVMELANAAIDKTAEFFASIGIPQRLSEVGVDDSHFEAMADHIPTCWWPLSGALRPIDKAGVIEILRASL